MSLINFQAQRQKTSQVIVPVDNDGTLITSVIVDRKGYDTAKLIVSYAAASGTPTTVTTAISFYSNNTNDTVTPVKLVDLETALDIAAAGVKEYDIDLSACERYVYATFDSTYSGGTSPKNIVSAVLVLGSKYTQPANGATTVYGR